VPVLLVLECQGSAGVLDFATGIVKYYIFRKYYIE
jgi:hypothetical protein